MASSWLVTTSDNFRAGFKTLSFSQPVYSLFAANEGTNLETAGRTVIEKIYMYIFFFLKNTICTIANTQLNFIRSFFYDTFLICFKNIHENKSYFYFKLFLFYSKELKPKPVPKSKKNMLINP